MVYLLNSRYSENQPNAWLCGGALVSTKHVLTSAACLTEVSHIYVIAGYKKYVSGDQIQDDACAWTRKQKIVKIIIPKAFNPSMWMHYDVGLGIVEKPYNFFDLSYRKVCSYEPGSISINYNGKMEEPHSYVVALGWGAAKARKPGTVGDINSKYLMEAHAIVTNTSYCRKQFPKIEKYLFLCTYGSNEDVKTRVVKNKIKIVPSSSTTTKKLRKICSTSTSSTRKPKRHIKGTWTSWRCGGNGDKQIRSKDTPAECVDTDSTELLISQEALVWNGSGTSLEHDVNNKTFNGNKLDINDSMSRRQGVQGNYPGNYLGGICQNDHGGPLIAFTGDLQVVIGVALNSVYDKKYECEGPYLYLSTARSVNLIKCLFTTDKEKRKKCQSLNYDRNEHDVDWPSEQETSNIYDYGKGPSTVRLRPNIDMGQQYKLPNHDIDLKYTRPIYNIGLAYKRPSDNMGLPY